MKRGKKMRKEVIYKGMSEGSEGRCKNRGRERKMRKVKERKGSK